MTIPEFTAMYIDSLKEQGQTIEKSALRKVLQMTQEKPLEFFTEEDWRKFYQEGKRTTIEVTRRKRAVILNWLTALREQGFPCQTALTSLLNTPLEKNLIEDFIKESYFGSFQEMADELDRFILDDEGSYGAYITVVCALYLVWFGVDVKTELLSINCRDVQLVETDHGKTLEITMPSRTLLIRNPKAMHLIYSYANSVSFTKVDGRNYTFASVSQLLRSNKGALSMNNLTFSISKLNKDVKEKGGDKKFLLNYVAKSAVYAKAYDICRRYGLVISPPYPQGNARDIMQRVLEITESFDFYKVYNYFYYWCKVYRSIDA